VGNNVTTIKKVDELDQEWVQLILEALKMGLDKVEIREFLKKNEVEMY
jgi:hypothetical protein